LEVPRQVEEFKETLRRYEVMRKRQHDERERLRVVEIKSEEHKE
jgi:hypothetical protein